jgi:hypothetical protein
MFHIILITVLVVSNNGTSISTEQVRVNVTSAQCLEMARTLTKEINHPNRGQTGMLAQVVQTAQCIKVG